MAETPSTTQVVPLKDISGNMVILKDGAVRSVIDVSAINFELRSTDEQLAIIQQFQNFLNSIDFTIQIIVQSRKFNIEDYLAKVEEATAQITNDMLQVQAEEYMRFVRELSDLANIMKKKFYIVIPIEVTHAKKSKSLVSDLKGMFAKKKDTGPKEGGPTEEEMQVWNDQLVQRSGLISGGLQGMGLQTKLLEQEELVALFTSLYSPEVPEIPK